MDYAQENSAKSGYVYKTGTTSKDTVYVSMGFGNVLSEGIPKLGIPIWELNYSEEYGLDRNFVEGFLDAEIFQSAMPKDVESENIYNRFFDLVPREGSNLLKSDIYKFSRTSAYNKWISDFQSALIRSYSGVHPEIMMARALTISTLGAYYLEDNTLYEFDDNLGYQEFEAGLDAFILGQLERIAVKPLHAFQNAFAGTKRTNPMIGNIKAAYKIFMPLLLKVHLKWPLKDKSAISVNGGLVIQGKFVKCSVDYNTKYRLNVTYVDTPLVDYHLQIMTWMRQLFRFNDSINWFLSLLFLILITGNLKLWVILRGPSGAGKTYFISYLKNFFGNCQAGFAARNLNSKDGSGLNPGLAGIMDVRFAFAEEGLTNLDPETIKAFAGGESEVYVRKMRENGKSQAPGCTMFFTTNSKPTFCSPPDDATIRRICMFDFVHRFESHEKVNYNTSNHYNALFQILMNIDPVDLDRDVPREVVANRESFQRCSKLELQNVWDQIVRCPDAHLKLSDINTEGLADAYVRAAITNHYGETFNEMSQGWYNLKAGKTQAVTITNWPVPELIFPNRKYCIKT